MSNVKITLTVPDDATGKQFVRVYSPYNTEFVARAKKLGGMFGRNQLGAYWIFPLAVKDHVKQVCLDIYGENGDADAPVDYVTLRVVFPFGYQQGKGGIEFAGRSIAYASGRDSGAKLGDKVAIIDGHASSGGSVKNWTTTISKGAVVEIYDLPRAIAEKAVAEHDEYTEPSIIESAPDTRRADLVARIAALESQLAEAKLALAELA